MAEVFTRIPDALRAPPRKPNFALRPDGRIDCFLEGPAFDRENFLYVVDSAYGRLFRIAPSGEVGVAVEYDGQPGGLALHPDGRVFITDRRHGIMAFDPQRGDVRLVLGELPGGIALHGVNDLVFARNGDLYFTDQGHTGLQHPAGRLVRIGADGMVELLLDCIPSPNGLVLSVDESFLLLAVTRANAIWHMRVPPRGGKPQMVGNFIQLTGGPGGGPDGLALDSAGNLAICHVQLGTVWLFSALGEPMLRVRSPTGRMTTNAAYGIADADRLYITESETGTILRARMPVVGQVLPSHG